MLIPIHPIPVKILAINTEFRYLAPIAFISPIAIESVIYLEVHEIWLIRMISGQSFTISSVEFDSVFRGIMPPLPKKETEN